MRLFGKFKRNLPAFAAGCLAAALSLPAFAQSKGQSLTLSAVKVEGNKNVSSLVIYGHLEEKEGDVFSVQRVRDDIHNLFSMGDFKNIKAEIEPGPKPGQAVLTFRVEERPLIRKITFTGNRKWDAKKFLESMRSAVGAAFDQSKLNDDLETIKKMYLDEGYSNISVTDQVQTDAKDNKVDVAIDILEGSQIKIGGIKVIGAEAFSSRKVASQTVENKEGGKYKPDQLEDDMKKIEDFYHDQGYLKAVVLDHSEKLDPRKKRVYITIRVREGEQYTLGTVDFQGNILFSDDDLMKQFGIKKGEVLSQKDLDEGSRRIKSLYADKGYIYAVVNPALSYDDELKRVNISYQISEGQVAYVQDIKIVGNYKTRDYVIRRELAIKPGDKFEASKIRESAQNLYNLGYFDEVNPEVEPGDQPGKEILIFRVKERKTGSISVGGGYSSVDGFVGNLKLEEANLFGKGQHVNLDLQFGAYNTSFSVGFTEPWLFNTPTSLGLNAFDTTQVFISAVPDPTGNNQLYTEVQAGGSISVGRKLSRYWSVFGTYTWENVQITNVNSYYATVGTAVQPLQPSNTTTSSFTPRIVYDSRDNYFDPTTGWKDQLSIELAGGPLGFDNNYIKVIGDVSHFIPLPAGFVFGQHLRLGVAQGYWFPGRGYTDIPLYAKFFAGGTDTIRGYNERTVGPLVGGNALFVSNTEIKHELVGPLRGVAFFDAGDAWTSIWNTSESHVQYGAGVGIRLTIPGTVMAIRLDYGWPIDSNLSSLAAPPGGVLHFNLGNLF